MKISTLLINVFISCILSGCISPSKKEETKATPKYTPSWESLAKHNEEPDWFKDAKFGIYFHWGVYSVPAFGNEWYPRHMHFEKKREFQHHLKKYGHPSEFGYHDFIPLFKAENFDAQEWAGLFKKAGARFAGPVAEHHDGFSMWASKVTPWNALGKGPKRDITGELEKAIKGNGMKFITTFHHARHLQRYDKTETKFSNSHYPLFEGMPPANTNEETKYLYGNMPEEEWLESIWFGKLKEVIGNYQPDIIWFDSWLDQIPESYRQKFCAFYLNEAQKWGKEVVIVRKQNDLPLDVSIDDLEKSRKNEMGKKVWMADETVSTGSWCYTENLTIKPAADVLHVLIDIASKNGVLLLNISPKADGTITDGQKDVLLKLGEWLGKYGEAIYETRPWYTFGEGPTKEPEGHFRNHNEFLKIKYSNADVRYTTKGKDIYATVLGSPTPNKEVLFKAFAENSLPNPITINDVSVLGCSEKIKWDLCPGGLKVKVPSEEVDQMAVVFKIET